MFANLLSRLTASDSRTLPDTDSRLATGLSSTRAGADSSGSGEEVASIHGVCSAKGECPWSRGSDQWCAAGDGDGDLEGCLRAVARAEEVHRAAEAGLRDSRAAAVQAALASDLCVSQARQARFSCETEVEIGGELRVSVRDRDSGACLARWILDCDPLLESAEAAASSSVPLAVPGGECVTLVRRGDRTVVSITARCIPEEAVSGTGVGSGAGALGTWVIGDFSVREGLAAAEVGQGVRVNQPEMAVQERRVQHFSSLAEDLEADLARVYKQGQYLLDFLQGSHEPDLANKLCSLNAEAGECLRRLRSLHSQVRQASTGLDNC